MPQCQLGLMQLQLLYFGGWLASGSNEGNAKAKEYFRRAYDIDPSDTEGLSRYAKFAWRCLKDLDLARKLYDEALAEGESSVEVLRSFAQILEKTGKDKKRALQLRRRADALEKKNKAKTGKSTGPT